MDTDNSQIYKVAKYLDKYTKDGAYLQKLNKYLHKVHKGGNAIQIVGEIQCMVGQVISMHDDERKALMAKLQKLSGSKDITLENYNTFYENAIATLKSSQQNPLETNIFHVYAYDIDKKDYSTIVSIEELKTILNINDIKSLTRNEYEPYYTLKLNKSENIRSFVDKINKTDIKLGNIRLFLSIPIELYNNNIRQLRKEIEKEKIDEINKIRLKSK